MTYGNNTNTMLTMKYLLILTLVHAFFSFSQSTPALYFPDFKERPAYHLKVYENEESPYTQREFFKTYFPLYAYKKVKRLTAVEVLSTYFSYKASFEKEAFDIFKIFQDKREPKIENDLSFENDSYDFSSLLDAQYGVCMGVSSVIRKFNMLAYFDINNQDGRDVPLRHENEKKWRAYYEGLIDRVMNNMPTIIPGFYDLEDLSSHGNFYTYLQKHSLDQWALNNLTLRGGLREMLGGLIKNRFSKKKGLRLYRQLRKRLSLHYNPKVYLTQPLRTSDAQKPDGMEDLEIWIHVMQVYSLSEMKKDGSYTVSLWDPNYPASHPGARAMVDINSQGKALYYHKDLGDGKEELSDIDIYKYDDAEIAEILINYKKFCSETPKPRICP